MKKRKIEKLIFNTLMFLPLILVLVLFCLNFSSLWQSGNNPTTNDVFAQFNGIIANFSFVENLTNPIKYLLNTIFGMNATISLSMANLVLWLVLIELIHLLYDILIFIPRAIRNMIDKGLGD